MVPTCYLLFMKTLPDFVPRFDSSPRMLTLGAPPAANAGGGLANSSFSAPTLGLDPPLGCLP